VVEPFRERLVEQQARPLRAALATWLRSVADAVTDAEPTMPDGVTDRAAEIWEPLLAIADATGGHWPTTARQACRHFVLTDAPAVDSLGVQLLADVRDVFTEAGTDRMPTRQLLAALLTLDDGPWHCLADGPLTARLLSRTMRRYDVAPVTFDAKIGKAKGYVTFPTSGKQTQAGLNDAWSRYLPEPDIGNQADHAVTDPVAVTTSDAGCGYRPPQQTRSAVTP
jgi:hypothetical protein